MSIIKKPTSRAVMQFTTLVMLMLAGAGKAWAQTCDYSITTAAAPVPTSVPSLSMLGVALLIAAVGFLVWRKGKFPGSRFMAIVLLAATAMLANQGGGGLVQQAYAAVLDVVLTNPAGESTAGTAQDGDTLTFRNASGVPLLISAITPTSTTCGEGTVIAVNETCSTTVACTTSPVQCGTNESPVNGVCRCTSGHARWSSDNMCRVSLFCNGTLTQGVDELLCSD